MRLGFLFSFLFLSHFMVSQNILISNEDYPNEPSIMIDPKNPNHLIAASNIDNYYVSVDTGRTWYTSKLTSSHGVWGDPVISVDTSGNFYFFHLSNPQNGSWIDRIVCQKSTDGGATWSDGSYAGLNGTKAQDKQWCAVNRNNNHLFLTWTQFDDYGSSNQKDSSTILFSKSIDQGKTWSSAKRINHYSGDCIDSDNTVEGAVPAIGPNGEIYVAWAGPKGLVFNKSLDEGETWMPKEKIIDPMPTGWDYAVSGIFRANGLPITACDLSNGPHKGTIYVNWSDQRNGPDNTDIWLMRSTDGGDTWNSPIKVNDDNSNKQQFLTWMAIDQVTGYLYFVFYDRRNYTNNLTDVYLAVSRDGGLSFANHKISDSPFLPNPDIFFGDYNNIVVHNGIIRPIWTRLHNNELTVWTHLIEEKQLLTAIGDTNDDKIENEITTFPNPTSHITYVSFKIRNKSKVNLDILDDKGQKIRSIINNEFKNFGKYIEEIDFDKLGIKSGIYTVTLKIDDQIKSNRIVVID